MTDRSEPAWIEAVQEERRAEVERFNARRNLEWRLALALWGGFGLAANALRELHLEDWAKWVATSLGLIVVVMHLLWVRNFMVRASVPNWRRGKGLTDILLEALGITTEELEAPTSDRLKVKGPTWWRRTVTWLTAPYETDKGQPHPGMGHYWQVGITLLLGAFVVLIVWR